METALWVMGTLFALALAVGVIAAIVIASRRPGQPLGLRNPNRGGMDALNLTIAAVGSYESDVTPGRERLRVTSQESENGQARAQEAAANARAREAEANATVRIAEIAQRGNLLAQAVALGQPRFFAGGQGSAAERQPAPAPAATPVVVNVYNTTPPAPARGGGGAAADGGGGAPARGNRRGAADPAAGGT